MRSRASPPTTSSDTDAGINDVAASGNPLAAHRDHARCRTGGCCSAPKARRSSSRTSPIRLIDAATGQPVAGARPPISTPVRLNNRLRRSIDAALGGLTLMAPDPAKRLEAAQAVFKSQRRKRACRRSTRRIAKETDAAVKQALTEARAAVVLYLDSATDADKIAAVAVIRERGDQDALALLGGLPADTRRAGEEGRSRRPSRSIQSSLAIWTAVQNAWYGLSLGSVLLLAAIGLAITFGVMGVINMAHGEMVMLGAYTTFVVQEVIRAHNPALFDYSLAIAIPLAFLVAGVRRHPDRAQHHPLPLRPAAGDAARHLGPVADPAAGGAHRLRPDQQARSATRPG